MSDTKFTPGPWKVSDDGGGPYIVAVRERAIELVVEAIGPFDDDDQSQANANLIASAPDLYAALEEVDDEHAGGESLPRDTMERVLAALKKARGES